MKGSSPGQRNFSTRNFLGQEIHSHLLRPTQPSTNWMENDYQLLLRVKSCSALVGLASNMWVCLWRRKHHIRKYCLQVANSCKGVLQFIANEVHLKYS